MNHKSHRGLAKLLFPKVKYKDIDAVNSAIDNPTKKSKLFADTITTSNIFGDGKANPFDVYGLGKTAPHRRVNHDPVTASIVSFIESPKNGIMLGNLHLILDVIGENIKKQQGVPLRDLYEAQLNVIIDQLLKKKQRLPF